MENLVFFALLMMSSLPSMEVKRKGQQIELKAKIDFSNKYVKSLIALSAVYVVTKIGYHQVTRYQKRSRANQKREAKLQQLSVKHKCLKLYDQIIKSDTASLILSLSATGIRQHIIEGKVSCAEVHSFSFCPLRNM